MSDYARSLSPRISKQVVHLEEKNLLEGAMATGALVALADQKLSVEESLMIQTFAHNAELLKIYDAELALTLYTRFVERMRADYTEGKQHALDAVERCANDIDAAELIVQVGIAVAKADEIFVESELEMIEEICDKVGIEGLDTIGLAGSQPTRLD